MKHKKRIIGNAPGGIINELVQPVKRPKLLSRERWAEIKSIRQATKVLKSMDCRFCDNNNTLISGSSDLCMRCHLLQRNITARRTYLKGGMLLAPGSPYERYKLSAEDASEVDESGKLIRIAGLDIETLAGIVAERLTDPHCKTLSETSKTEDTPTENTTELRSKTLSETSKTEDTPTENTTELRSKTLENWFDIPPIGANQK